MPEVTGEQLAELRPYIAGEVADERGEVGMSCPLHPDAKRSASINLKKGCWYCHAGCGGGSVRQLLDQRAVWHPPLVAASLTAVAAKFKTRKVEAPDIRAARRWHRRLLDEVGALDRLRELRGIMAATAERGRIGWDGRFFKLPVFGPDRELINIRTYDPTPGVVRRKIWGIRGHNAPVLYPLGVLGRVRSGDAIIICEGEWDALLALQSGYHAITRTGSAKVWNPDWSDRFVGLRVFVCHDADDMGQEANDKVAESLASHAAEVSICQLPYPVEKKNGKDLTDYLREADTPELALGELMKGAERW